MSKRDQHLAATKYKGQKSASQAKAEKEGAAGTSGQDTMSVMRTLIGKPRSQESVERAAKHRSGLPPPR